ncbi:protein eva-1 homolog A isoform X1 [Sarcophilus harrisii]|uniref:protein eva-1 homolog A isoform X1 n=1 Tax=Sarcophilus harrisii TaxID=9305 RepID=UPI001301D81A|nr:protein eva-1 homolog A isoform X1 [Sarcophilus harrisii]XP_031805409.1 protein eva-1 homolog A isoform X1 [Sarcophilus harrisii]
MEAALSLEGASQRCKSKLPDAGVCGAPAEPGPGGRRRRGGGGRAGQSGAREGPARGDLGGLLALLPRLGFGREPRAPPPRLLGPASARLPRRPRRQPGPPKVRRLQARGSPAVPPRPGRPDPQAPARVLWVLPLTSPCSWAAPWLSPFHPLGRNVSGHVLIPDPGPPPSRRQWA